MAGAWAKAGFNVALAGYRLCPDISVRDLTASIQAVPLAVVHALPATQRNLPIILAGHSAGAHLAIELALAWKTRNPATATLAGVVAISGIYDLTPLVPTTLNERLRLDLPRPGSARPYSGCKAAYPRGIPGRRRGNPSLPAAKPGNGGTLGRAWQFRHLPGALRAGSLQRARDADRRPWPARGTGARVHLAARLAARATRTWARQLRNRHGQPWSATAAAALRFRARGATPAAPRAPLRRSCGRAWSPPSRPPAAGRCRCAPAGRPR